MRLSSLSLVDRYTKSFRLTDTTLVERGPNLSVPSNPTSEKATGTEDARPCDQHLPPCLTQKDGHQETSTDRRGQKAQQIQESTSDVNPCGATKNPAKSGQWAREDSNLRRHKPADLQSAPFVHFGTRPDTNRSRQSSAPDAEHSILRLEDRLSNICSACCRTDGSSKALPAPQPEDDTIFRSRSEIPPGSRQEPAAGSQ